MPKAEIPTSLHGWLIAIGAGIVGFLAGFLFISLMVRIGR
jgi:hypothetical protein